MSEEFDRKAVILRELSGLDAQALHRIADMGTTEASGADDLVRALAASVREEYEDDNVDPREPLERADVVARDLSARGDVEVIRVFGLIPLAQSAVVGEDSDEVRAEPGMSMTAVLRDSLRAAYHGGAESLFTYLEDEADRLETEWDDAHADEEKDETDDGTGGEVAGEIGEGAIGQV